VLAVTEDEAIFATGPDRHQGGTPNIPGAIAMAKALRFLQDIGMDAVRHHEMELTKLLLDGLATIEGVEVYGPKDPQSRLGVVSFNIEGIHHDLAAAILNNEAVIATRNGCFCAHPYLHLLLRVGNVDRLVNDLKAGKDTELPGAVRATIGLFNTAEEVQYLVEWVRKLARREWTGRYDLEKRDYCKPVFFEFDGESGISGASEHATARV
jgi:selenocysteine lyase/cysteine desulfurase